MTDAVQSNKTAHYPRHERGEIRAIIRISAGIDVVFSIC
jgi:hypothetical protein